MLMLVEHSSLTAYARRVPGWQELIALARAAYDRFAALWRRLLADARRALSLRRLVEALTGPSGELSARAVLDVTWQSAVDEPGRILIPALALELVNAAGQAMQADLSRLAARPTTWTAGLPETTQWMQTYTGTQLREIGQTSLTTVRRVLHAGWQAGASPSRLATQVRAALGLTPRQAQTIARLRQRLVDEGRGAQAVRQAVQDATARAIRLRTELIARTEAQAFVQGGAYQALQQQLRLGLLDRDDLRRVWRLGPRPCPTICVAIPDLNPDGVDVDSPFRTPVGPVLFPPVHPDCLTGDTLITPSTRISATSKRWYEGEVVVLRTAHKKFLTCTPNHPILTGQGWVPSGLLHTGDNIICYSGQQRILAGDKNINTMPTMLQEIVETLGHTGGMSSTEVPIAAEAFHGDGKGSQVAVIGTNRLLRDRLYPSFTEQPPYRGFESRSSEPFLLERLCHATLAYERHTASASRLTCCCSLCVSLRRRHALLSHALRFALGTQGEVTAAQPPIDDRTADSATLRESLNRHAIGVEMDNLIDITRMYFRGHVFNLQTDDGWYIGNGIIVHNCQCSVEVRRVSE